MATHYFKYDRNARAPLGVAGLLCIVILGATLVQFVVDGHASDGPVGDLFAIYPVDTWTGAWWQILTSALVHGSILHLVMNLLFIWSIGRAYEPVAGHLGFLTVFVAGVVCGASAVLLLGDVMVTVVGASGGAFALMGGLIAALYARTNSLLAIWQNPGGQSLLVLCGVIVMLSFMPGISGLGHAGGLISGLMIGFLLERRRMGGLSPAEKLGAGLLAAVIIGTAAYALKPVHRGGYGVALGSKAFGLRWVSSSDPAAPKDSVPGMIYLAVDSSRADPELLNEAVRAYQRGYADIDDSERYLKTAAELDRMMKLAAELLNGKP